MLASNIFEERETVCYEMPRSLGESILHANQAILVFPGTSVSVDIGSCAYLSRSNERRKRGGPGVLVALRTFQSSRLHLLRETIEITSNLMRQGHTALSAYSKLNSFIRFLNWLDSDVAFDKLTNEDVMVSSVSAYIEDLKEKMKLGLLISRTTSRYQNDAIFYLAKIFSIRNLSSNFDLIFKGGDDGAGTEAPPEEDVGRQLALDSAIFTQLCNLLLDEEKYPFKLLVPNFAGEEGDKLWVFPFKIPWMSSHEKNENKLDLFRAVNFQDGTVRTYEEICEKYKQKHMAKSAVDRANDLIACANLEFKHPARKKMGVIANNAFFDSFIANTGMNMQSAIDLRWDNVYEIGSEAQGVRSVKLRAGGKDVFFAITASFLPKLRRFLDLRKYLLDGADFDYLFFSLNGRDGSPEKLTRFSHSSNVTSFKKILPCYPGIMPRKWRANLGDWATDNADISTTAVLLQNDQKTVARHYGRGTKKKMIKEVGGFLKEIEVRIESPIKRLGSTSCAVGTCGDPNNPSGGDVDNAVKPDCRLPEGCLFCEKYFVIADDVDVRKLISCEFCIFKTKSFSSNSAEWEATFRPILQRITAIADKIGSASSELASLVERVRKEVYENGVLDKYWARKLDLTLALWGEL